MGTRFDTEKCAHRPRHDEAGVPLPPCGAKHILSCVFAPLLYNRIENNNPPVKEEPP